MANVGAWSDGKAATPKIQNISHQMKSEAEKAAHQDFRDFTAILYKEQIVSGTNYAIMLHVGNNKYADLKVFKPLSDTEQPKFIKIKYPAPDPLPIEKL